MNGMAGCAELDRARGLRAKCKSLSKTTWNNHERRQNNSVENAFQRFALSFVSFLRRKHDFRQRISTFVWRILFETQNLNFWFQHENSRFEVRVGDRSSRTCWHAQWLSCWKILPVGVRGTKNVWCLSSLLFSVTLPGVTKWPTEKLLQNSRKNKTNLCLESPDLKGSVILLYFHFSRDRENTANQKQIRFFFSENKFNSENRWPNDWRCAFLALFFLH